MLHVLIIAVYKSTTLMVVCRRIPMIRGLHTPLTALLYFKCAVVKYYVLEKTTPYGNDWLFQL